MRRKLPVATVLAATLVLAACGGDSEGDDDETTDETPEETDDGGESETDAEAETDDTEDDAGDEAAENVEGELTIWVDETRQDAVEAAAEAFTEETGVEVVTVLRNFEDVLADFVAQVPSGEGPDITVGAHDWLGELTANGVVAPLDLGGIEGDFSEVAMQAMTYDEQVYGLPYAVENIALIRNTDLAPDAPATWDEAVSMGEEAGAEYPILIQTDTEGDPYTYYPLQTSFGAYVFEMDDDGNYTTDLALGGDEGAAFAEWLAEQGEQGEGNLNTSITYDIAVEAFGNEESPFIIGGPWMLASFDDLNLAVDPLPDAGPEPAGAFAGVQGFFVNALTPDAIIANDFLINYMSTEEAQLELYEAGDRAPALTSAADIAAEDELTAGFIAAGEDAVPMPAIPEMGQVWQFWGVTETAIISGSADDPVAAWDEMVDDIQAAIDEAG